MDLWDIGNADRPDHLATITPGLVREIRAIAIAPHGRQVAVGGGDWNDAEATVERWGIADRANPRRLTPLPPVGLGR